MNLQAFIDDEKLEKWTQEHLDNTDPELVSEETLGIIISQWSEWDGPKIMRVLVSALEDANFHDEAEIIEQIIEAEYEFDQPEFTLTARENN